VRILPLVVVVLTLSTHLIWASDDFDPYIGQSRTVIESQKDAQDRARMGDYATARREFDEAIRSDPKAWSAYYSRACLDFAEHKWQQTIDDATVALRLNSSFSKSAILRADANAKLGHYDAAIREIDHVIALGRLGNARARALNESAWLRSTCPDAQYRNGQLAVSHAAMACRVTWDRNASYLDTLATANAETGNFETAIRIEETALSRRQSSAMRKHHEQHLAAFKSHQPWREVSK
jgi:tetratricopeptide (TPR) repeat protein